MSRRKHSPHKRRRQLAAFSFLFLSICFFLLIVPHGKLPERLKDSKAIDKAYDIAQRTADGWQKTLNGQDSAHENSAIEPASGGQGYKHKDREKLDELIEGEVNP